MASSKFGVGALAQRPSIPKSPKRREGGRSLASTDYIGAFSSSKRKFRSKDGELHTDSRQSRPPHAASGNCTGISENSVAAWANTQKVFTHSQSIVSKTKKAGDRIIYGHFGRVRGEVRKKIRRFSAACSSAAHIQSDLEGLA